MEKNLELSFFDGVQLENKTIPASTSIKNVKVMVNHLFKIRTTDQKLYYKRHMVIYFNLQLII